MGKTKKNEGKKTINPFEFIGNCLNTHAGLGRGSEEGAASKRGPATAGTVPVPPADDLL